MVGESNQDVFLIPIDAFSFAEFEISEFEISRVDCRLIFSIGLEIINTVGREAPIHYYIYAPSSTIIKMQI